MTSDRRFAIDDPYPHLRFFPDGDIGLHDVDPLTPIQPPAIASHQEFTFYFLSHDPAQFSPRQ